MGIRLGTPRTAAIVVTFCGAPALGVPLNIVLNSSPDLTAGLIDTSYTAGNLMMMADGFSLTYDDGSGSVNVSGGGQFIIDALIDNAGNFISGTLTATGTIPSLGHNSGTLLTANLTAFGFDEPDDPLEFEWSVTGGDLQVDYGAFAATIMSFTGFDGDWSTDWSDDGIVPTAIANTGVPAPGSVALIGLAGCGLIGRRRR